ncbi:MAG: winged helix-turn-helix transcriptional regulator [Euryarchaeota archaeon]|nr:winged helix-turn-helix transcriptional regulator [Euryarchaeota archaeon]
MNKKLLWWIFAVSSGGKVRARILHILKDKPSTCSQLAKELNLTYQTIRYHLAILLENKVIVSSGDTSIAIYFLSDEMEGEWGEFMRIWERIEKTRKTIY